MVIEEYFERLRPLALGIAACGGSFGNMAFPWITKALFESYGWRGKVIIMNEDKFKVFDMTFI